ncbi:MAG TPA: amidohydrolase family protein [Thermoanaerobaculia bacterium]|nr:amidohydrolase family protein [Thermoanaerobaculia bacterium]
MDARRTLRLASTLLGLALALGGSAVPAAEPEPTYDVVIRGARVLDGMGNPAVFADLAIRDGRIAALGVIPGRGRQEVAAAGLWLAPGFIDMMDQSGGVLPRNGLAENKVRQGVTTAIGGEGGLPVPAEDAADYFAGLEASGISLNFGSYYSAAQARVAVVGAGDGAASDDQIARMQELLDVALRAGAMGMTTALIYPPSSFQGTPELIELARVPAHYGALYASHIRDEGRGLVGAVEEAIAIGERAGLPVEVFHLKSAYRPGWGLLMHEAVAAVERARARGVDVAADLYPYTAGGTGLEATVPSWVFADGWEVARQRLADAAVRERLKGELVTGVEGWWNIVEASGGWENVVLVNARNPENARFERRSIAEIASELGKDPADAAWDLVLEGDGRVMAIYHMMSERDIRTALAQPWTSIGSDAGAALVAGEVDLLGLPHPRSYGTFPRVIARYVREMGVLTLEEAVRKMTSWPATRLRLIDRGAIREGMWADLVLFDFERIEDRATWEDPVAFPEGIRAVWVNGVAVVEDGRHTGARPGHVIYGPGRWLAEEGRPPFAATAPAAESGGRSR